MPAPSGTWTSRKVWDHLHGLCVRCQKLTNYNGFSLCLNSEQITKQQSHIDRLYVSLKDMVEHRKTKLEQQYWLYQLKKDVDELEKWITEREAVATSTELGHDLEDVTVSLLHLTLCGDIIAVISYQQSNLIVEEHHKFRSGIFFL